jgi:hypothetical protein
MDTQQYLLDTLHQPLKMLCLLLIHKLTKNSMEMPSLHVYPFYQLKLQLVKIRLQVKAEEQ